MKFVSLVASALFLVSMFSVSVLAQYQDDYNAATGQVSRTFSKVQASLPVTITENVLSPAGTPVYQITLDTSTLVLQARIFVEGTDAESAALDVLPGGIVYKYVNITGKNFDDSDVDNAEIYFRVQKSWMAESNVLSSSVKMLRLHSGEWQELPTAIVSESESSVEYKSDSPGFSIFAIAGEGVSPVQEGPSQSIGPEVVEVDPTEDVVETRYSETLNLALVVGLVVAAIAALFIVPGSVFRRKKLRR